MAGHDSGYHVSRWLHHDVCPYYGRKRGKGDISAAHLCLWCKDDGGRMTRSHVLRTTRDRYVMRVWTRGRIDATYSRVRWRQGYERWLYRGIRERAGVDCACSVQLHQELCTVIEGHPSIEGKLGTDCSRRGRGRAGWCSTIKTKDDDSQFMNFIAIVRLPPRLAVLS
jgi:hypothetical protein